MDLRERIEAAIRDQNIILLRYLLWLEANHVTR